MAACEHGNPAPAQPVNSGWGTILPPRAASRKPRTSARSAVFLHNFVRFWLRFGEPGGARAERIATPPARHHTLVLAPPLTWSFAEGTCSGGLVVRAPKGTEVR